MRLCAAPAQVQEQAAAAERAGSTDAARGGVLAAGATAAGSIAAGAFGATASPVAAPPAIARADPVGASGGLFGRTTGSSTGGSMEVLVTIGIGVSAAPRDVAPGVGVADQEEPIQLLSWPEYWYRLNADSTTTAPTSATTAWR